MQESDPCRGKFDGVRSHRDGGRLAGGHFAGKGRARQYGSGQVGAEDIGHHPVQGQAGFQFEPLGGPGNSGEIGHAGLELDQEGPKSLTRHGQQHMPTGTDGLVEVGLDQDVVRQAGIRQIADVAALPGQDGQMAGVMAPEAHLMVIAGQHDGQGGAPRARPQYRDTGHDSSNETGSVGHEWSGLP